MTWTRRVPRRPSARFPSPRRQPVQAHRTARAHHGARELRASRSRVPPAFVGDFSELGDSPPCLLQPVQLALQLRLRVTAPATTTALRSVASRNAVFLSIVRSGTLSDFVSCGAGRRRVAPGALGAVLYRGP